MIKTEYEISLWKRDMDREHVPISLSGNEPSPMSASMSTEDSMGMLPFSSREVTVPYKGEYRIAVLGTNEMTAATKAFAPVLTENINGTNTLEFKMYYVVPAEPDPYLFESFRRGGKVRQYKNKKVDNALALQVNPESIIKLKYNDKWYDFIVKEIVKDKSDRSLTFHCIDAHVNELSRTGYNLTFDSKLKNNVGTASELIERVLEGSSYFFDGESSDLLPEWIEEIAYPSFLFDDVIVHHEIENTIRLLHRGSDVLIYESQIYEILHSSGNSGRISLQIGTPNTEEIEDPLSTISVTPYVIDTLWTRSYDGLIFETVDSNVVWSMLNVFQEDIPSVRAERLLMKQLSTYDQLSEHYVDLFEATRNGVGYRAGDIIYKSTESIFDSPYTVKDLIINGRNFTNTAGWSGEDIVFSMWPLYSTETSESLDSFQSHSYLRMSSGRSYYNKAVTSSSHLLEEGLQVGEEYIVRFKIKGGSETGPEGGYLSSGMTPSLRTYDDTGFHIEPLAGGQSFASVTLLGKNADWIEYKMTINTSIPRVEIRGQRVGLFFSTSRIIWLQEVEMFKLSYGANEYGDLVMIEPGVLNSFSVHNTLYKYYNHTEHKTLNKKEIRYLWNNTVDWETEDIEPMFSPGAEKIRTLIASESNRFNILQSIAELFQAWIEFYIPHDPDTGHILSYNGRTPIKKVRIVKSKGRDLGLDFVHSVDIQGMKRTYQSNEITTKTIVKPNILSLANKDIVSISNALRNIGRVNYIFNFDYYISQGELTAQEVYYDFHSGSGGYSLLGYYLSEYQDASRKLAARRTELNNLNASLEIYEGLIHNTQDEIQKTKENLVKIAGATSWSEAQVFLKENADSLSVHSKVTTVLELQNMLKYYQTVRQSAELSKGKLEADIEYGVADVEMYLEMAQDVEDFFHMKYSAYIQEGVWSDENYIDDDLYFSDAQEIASRSARPQVAYEISVARLNMLEDFQHKRFSVGDIARVTDPEFLGMRIVDSLPTPIKEKVLLSEITYYLDEPNKDMYTVQNYRTQFEDLFQRIVANVQQLQHAQGGTVQSSNALAKNLGSLAEGEPIERSMLGNSILQDGYFSTEMIKVGSGSVFTPGYDPSTKADPEDVALKAEEEAFLAKEDIAQQLGYLNYDDFVIGATSGQKIMIDGYLNTNLIKKGQISTLNNKYSLDMETGKVIIQDGEIEGSITMKSGSVGNLLLVDGVLSQSTHRSSGGLAQETLTMKLGWKNSPPGATESLITIQREISGQPGATEIFSLSEDGKIWTKQGIQANQFMNLHGDPVLHYEDLYKLREIGVDFNDCMDFGFYTSGTSQSMSSKSNRPTSSRGTLEVIPGVEEGGVVHRFIKADGTMAYTRVYDPSQGTWSLWYQFSMTPSVEAVYQ